MQADDPRVAAVRVADFAEITRSTPEKSLLRPFDKTGGCNNTGRMFTTRHRGGGHKRQYCPIDFRRHDKDGVNARLITSSTIPTVPHRIALAALRRWFQKRTSSLRTSSLRAIVESGPAADIARQLLPAQHPVGTVIHCVESTPVAAQSWHVPLVFCPAGC